MDPVSRLAELHDRYDVLRCDVWGVLHDGRTAFPAAAQALRAARAAGVTVVLLTNVPRPSATMPRALARTGVPAEAWDAVVTSGDATRDELAQRSPGPVHRIGRQADEGLWDGLGLVFSDLAVARFLAIAGLRDADEDPGAYAEVLRSARDRDLELVCANPDVQVQVGDQLRWSAGSVAEAYRALGGRVVLAGKPHEPIYARADRVLAELVGGPVPRDRILAIGDGITTDLCGANEQGIDSLFVATGIHGSSLLVGGTPDGAVDRERAAAALADVGARADWVMPRLA
jgi:HAD superfamily hydrolase (TIGR01459 family)